ncbi:MAG: LuxR C-terminal-related transcriptional regulator [Comamonas sp.]
MNLQGGSGFEMYSNPPSMWPSFLVGQRSRPVRCLLVDDDIHFINVLHQELSADHRIHVVGRAATVKEAKRIIKAQDFDVALIDLTLPDGQGMQLLEYVHAHRPAAQYLVVSVTELEQNVLRAIELGASGYLVKHSWFGGYTQAVLQVANGGAAITPHLAKRLLQHFDTRSHYAHEQALTTGKIYDHLSQREQDILRMIACGYTSQEIAVRLKISHLTVNTHIRNTYRKLQVRSRAQAVKSALVRGLI